MQLVLYLGIEPFLICKILDKSQYVLDDPSIASFTMEILPYNEFSGGHYSQLFMWQTTIKRLYSSFPW